MTEHFTLKEFTRSETADRLKIANQPLGAELSALHFTAVGMERIRAYLGYPIKINSAYRCPKLNIAVGGVESSQHVKGEAVDFTCPAYGTPLQVCRALVSQLKVLGIDQLIMEGTWVHVSFTHRPRYEALTALGTKYVGGILGK